MQLIKYCALDRRNNKFFPLIFSCQHLLIVSYFDLLLVGTKSQTPAKRPPAPSAQRVITTSSSSVTTTSSSSSSVSLSAAAVRNQTSKVTTTQAALHSVTSSIKDGKWLDFFFMCSILLSTYTIMTKREVKMVGYWPNSFLVCFFKDKVDVHKNASRISLFKQACSIKYLALLIIMNQEGLVYFKTLQRKPTVFVALIINPQESLIYVF